MLRSQTSIYHALIFEDHRGIYKGQYLSIHFRRSLRQIHLYPTQGSFYNENSLQTHVYPLGNFIEPLRPNLDMIKALLHTCREEHPLTCRPRPHPINILRVIDCRRRRIVPAQEGQRYICLSYVWGRNAGVVEEPVINSVLPDALPRTIQSAIDVAIRLEIPFLWIDRYCTSTLVYKLT